jgi:hypothetical protein
MPEDAAKSFGKQVPMKRAGQPAELATAYVMLADPLSSYTSGRQSLSPAANPLSEVGSPHRALCVVRSAAGGRLAQVMSVHNRRDGKLAREIDWDLEQARSRPGQPA